MCQVLNVTKLVSTSGVRTPTAVLLISEKWGLKN